MVNRIFIFDALHLMQATAIIGNSYKIAEDEII